MKKLLSLSLLTLALVACGGSKEYLQAQAPVVSADLQVNPLQVYIGGKKLWVRLQVTNTSQTMLMIQRDAIIARLPNGQTVGRAAGTYTQHAPYILPPGTGHLVYVEFEEEGFSWHAVPSVQVDFANSVTRDGQPVPVPPLVITH